MKISTFAGDNIDVDAGRHLLLDRADQIALLDQVADDMLPAESYAFSRECRLQHENIIVMDELPVVLGRGNAKFIKPVAPVTPSWSMSSRWIRR